jgi:hypothetical protein
MRRKISPMITSKIDTRQRCTYTQNRPQPRAEKSRVKIFLLTRHITTEDYSSLMMSTLEEKTHRVALMIETCQRRIMFLNIRHRVLSFLFAASFNP